MEQKVLITTSGIGNRLGELTKYTNKSLVAVGDKPAISRIIENYPVETRFVITLGYQGEAVKGFLEIAYPMRNFEFVDVDNFDGPGSSLGYSMLQAAELLDEPFIFHASDTLVRQAIPFVTHNWIGGYQGENASEYTSFDCLDSLVTKTHPKGMDKFDYIYIGIAGIFSHEQFWSTLERIYESNPKSSTLNDVQAIQQLIESKHEFRIKLFNEWEDVGNIGALSKARTRYTRELETLAKNDEDIFKLEGKVIKYFSDPVVCSKRIERSRILAPAVPVIESNSKNFYKYSYVEGEIASDKITKDSFASLLDWADSNIWSKEIVGLTQSNFKEICKSFYFDKTQNRLFDFFDKTGLSDVEQSINGTEIPTISELIRALEKEELVEGHESVIHGDFILDNILCKSEGFVAIDWRQDFGGAIHTGDLYYDLAKLNHSLTMNHHMLNSGYFECTASNGNVSVNLERKVNLIGCEAVLERYIKSKGLSFRKVQLLTALIWLNMSPLHSHPLDIFLFHYGKLSLWNTLKSDKNENF